MARRQYTFSMDASQFSALKDRAISDGEAVPDILRLLIEQYLAGKTIMPGDETAPAEDGRHDNTDHVVQLAKAAIMQHPYLQWRTVDGPRACEDVAKYVEKAIRDSSA